MNILFLYGNAILPARGGVQRVTDVLADEFERRGNVVFYLSPAQEIDEEQTPISPRQIFMPSATLAAPENVDFFKKILRERRFDVVINQGALGYACSRFSYHAREVGVPVIGAVHNGVLDVARHYFEYSEVHWRDRGLGCVTRLFKTAPVRALLLAIYKAKYRRHFRELCANSARVVLLSEAFKADLAEYFHGKILPKNVRAISNPCTFAPHADGNAVLGGKRRELIYVGRIDFAQKRVDFLLKIWAKLEAAFPQWTLKIVGGGERLKRLVGIAEKLGLERVVFEGFQKNPEKYYRRGAIFCMTSVYEGFPMVLVEAAAFGCVPVAFDSFAAVRDIIADGENGALVPAFDLDAYAKTLAKLMRDDALRERLAANALSVPEKFLPKKIGDRWEALLKSVVGAASK